MKTSYSLLAFLLELGMLAAFVYWGYYGTKTGSGRFWWGFNMPVIAIILWRVLAAPRSKVRLNQPYLSGFKLFLFGLAAYGLYRSEQPWLALLLAFLAILVLSMEYTRPLKVN